MQDDRARLERVLRNFEYLSRRTQAPGDSQKTQERLSGPKQRAAVVCWDLSHNPAGRAYVLYQLLAPRWDVELIGPIWPRFGTTLWQPLRNEKLNWRALAVDNLTDLWCEGAAVALTTRFDLVVVSKPRLPGLLLGMLLAEQNRCPLILDFDEDERAFLQHHPEDAAASARKLLEEPYGTSGTLLATQYWWTADATTVASPFLRRQLGGRLIRHARDETAPLADRAEARLRLGYTPDDMVLAFIGTARVHKGLDRILAALAALADPRIKLMVVGAVPDTALLQRLRHQNTNQVTVHGNCDIKDLGSYLAAADLVPLLQEPDSAIAQSQFPAKLTDALQYGIKVVATETPPLRELGLSEAVDLIQPDGFADYLKTWMKTKASGTKPEQIRRIFEDEFGMRVNRARLDAAIAEAEWQSNPFSRAIPGALQALADVSRRARAEVVRPLDLQHPALMRGNRGLDVAFFWKQNDSDLFGRRSDMVVKYLLRSGRVRRIVHFDQSLRPAALRRMALAHANRGRDVGAAQFSNAVARTLRLRDHPRLARRVFLAHESGAAPSFGGRTLKPPRALADFVAASLRECDLDPSQTLAWVCPVVWNFGAIAERVKFSRIVVDLIDDERSWSATPEQHQRTQEEYEKTLHLADLVFTNGEGNKDRFSSLRSDIHVVPNGAEIEPPPDGTPLPAFLARLRHPTIGYIGNLRDRIDWPLVQTLAERRPGWDFVFIGPWGEKGVPTEIEALPNVILPGPLPYDVARLCLGSFDCAIVPHTRDAMTAAMNPLKVYNYMAAGLPVVATPIANLDDVADIISMAETADGFVAAIETALQSPPTGQRYSADRLRAFSWQNRVTKLLDLVEGLGASS